MALKPLLVKIGADTTQLERGLKRAGVEIAGLAKAAAAAGVLVGGALAAMTAQGMRVVDSQAKLARSLSTTTASIQVLERAGSLAGVSMSGIEQATKDLTRRLSQAAAGAGPAKDALDRLGLSAQDLIDLPLDQRVDTINKAIRDFIPAAQQAAVAGQLFGEEGSIAISRLDSATIRQATADVRDFGIAVSDEAAAKIEMANDAISRMGLVFDGLRNRLAVELAPVLQGIADRFNQLASSQSVQDAINRLVSAFGDLADVILSEDFLGVAVSGLEGIANISASVAEGMVTVSQNVEAVTLAFSGLAIAVAAAGGPLTVVAGLLAVALGGIAAWRSKAEDMEKSTDDARDALDKLNASMAIVPGSAEAAGRSAIDLANDNYELAESALAAAEAELAKRRAMREEKAVPGGVRGPSRARLFEAEDEAEAALQEAEAALEEARLRIRETRFGRPSGSDYGNNVAPPIQPEPIVITPLDIETPDIPSGGAAGLSTSEQLREQFEQRLEVLTEGLATEREVVAQWYEEGQTVLEDALAKGLLTEEEYREQRERLEEEHQKRMNAIKQAGAAADLATVAGAGAEILNAIGQNNKKALKIAKVFGAAEALISTYAGAANALKLPFPKNLAAAASIIAKGIGFVNAIKSVNDNGSTGGSGSTGATSTATQEPPQPTQTVAINLQGDTFSRASVEGLLEQIQSQLDRGGRLVFE